MKVSRSRSSESIRCKISNIRDVMLDSTYKLLSNEDLNMHLVISTNVDISVMTTVYTGLQYNVFLFFFRDLILINEKTSDFLE